MRPILYSSEPIRLQIFFRVSDNESYNNINFLFFTSILHTFQQNLERHVFSDYNDVSFNGGLSLLK